MTNLRILLFLWLLIFISSTYAQISFPERSNSRDENGLKTGAWLLFFDEDFEPTDKEMASFYRLINYEADQSVGIVEDYYISGQPQSSFTFLSEEETTFDQLMTHYDENGNFHYLLWYDSGQINYDKSITLFHQKLDQFEDERHPLLDAASMDILASLYRENGQMAESLSLVRKMKQLRLQELDEFHPLVIQSYYALGNLMMMDEMSDSALVNFDYIIKASENGQEVDPAYYGAALTLSARLFRDLGQHEKAIAYFDKNVQFAKRNEGKMSNSYVIAEFNLGLYFEDLGKFDEALKRLNEVLKVEEKLSGAQSSDYLYTFHEIARITKESGDVHQSLVLFKEELTIRKELGDTLSKNYAQNIHEIALLLTEDFDQCKEAIPLYKEALEIFGQLEDADNYYNTNHSLAVAYDECEDFTSALSLMKSNTSFYGKYIDDYPNNYISSHYYLAGLYRSIEQYTLADSIYQLVIPFAETYYGISNPIYASILNAYGLLHYYVGNYEVAEKYFLKALGITEPVKVEYPIRYAAIANSMGMILEIQLKYEAAEKYYQEAIKIRKSEFGEISTMHASALNNLAGIYDSMLEYEKALKLYFESIAIYEELNILSQEYAQTMINIGAVYYDMTEYANAEGWYRKAEEHLSINKDNLFYSNAILGLGNVYSQIGQSERAEPLLLEALKIRENKLGIESEEYGDAANNLGFVYDHLDQPNKSIEMFEKGLKARIAAFGEDHPDVAASYNNLSAVYQYQNLDTAIVLIKKAIEIIGLNEQFNLDSYALYKNNLGSMYKDLGEFNLAEKLYLEALHGFKEVYSETHRWYSSPLLNLAILKINQGDLKNAGKYIIESEVNLLRIIQDQFPSMNEEEKKIFWNSMKYHFELLHPIIIEQGISETAICGTAYDNILATKGLLLEASSKMRKSILQSGDSSLIKTFNQWLGLRQDLANAISMKQMQRISEGIDLNDLRSQINEYEKSLTNRSKAFAISLQQNPPTWKDVQEVLNQDEAAIELVRFTGIDTTGWSGANHYAAYVIKKKSKYPEIVYLGKAEDLEQRYLKRYRNNIKFKLVDNHSYVDYWKPLEDVLANVHKVYISAEGVYNQINLNTLQNPETNKYLLDELDIQMVTSTRELNKSKLVPIKEKPHAVLIGRPSYKSDQSTQPIDIENQRALDFERDLGRMFGSHTIPDLPGTEVEIRSIEDQLTEKGWKAESYFFSNATEDVIKSMSSPYLVHIATHGFFLSQEGDDKKDPTDISKKNQISDPMLRSGILLAGVSDYYINDDRMGMNDGVLTAYEATGLNLDDTELVVLSACETGLGDISYGEGVYGLQRGLEVAGAKSILMSLWKVDDNATQELMTNFYGEWIATNNKREAFRRAQATLREKYPNPYYWGAFTLIGE